MEFILERREHLEGMPFKQVIFDVSPQGYLNTASQREVQASVP